MDLQKLLSKQDLCTTESPSACVAKCPIHVDVKGLMEEISQGNFEKAYKILNKRLPFPRILSRICDHVCEEVCVREKSGGCVSIRELEKAAIKYGASAPPRGFTIPKNGIKIAVVGGGISGLTAATDLDKKGYTVTIYEKENRLGGRLWKFPKDILPDDIINEELESVYKSSIELKLNTELSDEEINSLIDEYDAVYIGIGKKIDGKFDKDTFQVGEKGLFMGGRAAIDGESVIFSASSGRRAAVSIDRFVHKKSLTAVRENEGSFDTPLRVNLRDVEELPAVKAMKKEGLSREEAVKEASRCIKCQCMECSKMCAHLRKYKMSPKQYIRQINHNEAIILGDHYANKMINSCTMCGLCAEACPSDLNLKDIILDTRKSMVERGKMPPSAHDFALKDMEFSNSEKFLMLKHQPGHDKSKFMFFPSCQLAGSSPEYVEKIYDYLTGTTSEGVGIMLGCCGAPAEWAGREELFKNTINDIIKKWESMGKPVFILACSTCSYIFKTYMPQIDFVSLWDYIVENGMPGDSAKNEKRVFTVHDACTSRYERHIQDSVREIINKLGHDIEELKYSKERTKCCGYGGLVFYANKEQAEDFIKERISESDKDYIVYCGMCRDLFASQGKRTLHVLDLMYGDDLDKLSERKGPRLWERQMNRSRLKASLLKKWGEEYIDRRESKLDIVISEEMKDIMEKRWILFQDVEQVIENAEAAGDKFTNPENGHYLARKVIKNVTYWVEYEKLDNSYVVYDAYSHRMEIVEV